MKIVTCTAKDHTGTIMLVWYNMPYLKKQLHQEEIIYLRNLIYKNGRITMEHPEIFTKEDYEAKQETLQPVYPLTSGLTNKLVSKAMAQTKTISSYSRISSAKYFRSISANGISSGNLEYSFSGIKEQLIKAKKRLIFDEFLFLSQRCI